MQICNILLKIFQLIHPESFDYTEQNHYKVLFQSPSTMMCDKFRVTLDPIDRFIATYVLVLMYAQSQQYHKLLYKNTLHVDEDYAKVCGLNFLDHNSKGNT